MRIADEIQRGLDSADPEERRQATTALGAAPAAAVVAHLIRALGDADWRVRKEATSVAIGLAPAPEILRALVETLGPNDDDIGRRNAAVEALSGYGAACVDALSVAVPGLDADGRKLAAEALGRSGQEAASVVLRTMLRDPDLNVRVAVLEGLAAIGATCVDMVAPVLHAHLDAEDQLVRLTALTGLNELAVAVEWSRVAPLLDDPALRAAALIAAGRCGDPEAAPVLVRLLAESRGPTYGVVLAAVVDFVRVAPEARRAARDEMQHLPPSSRARILTEAQGEADTDRRRRAVFLLGLLDDSEAARVATSSLSDPIVAAESEEALLMLGATAVDPLLELVANGSSPVRAIGIELVGEIVEPSQRARALQVLRYALEDSSDDIVAASLSALAGLGDESCLSAVVRFLDAPGARARRAARQALVGIARRHRASALDFVRHEAPGGPGAYGACLVIGTVEPPALGSEDADVDFLSLALSHNDARVRRAALDALARLRCGRAVEVVAFALTDEEPDVRDAAVRALGRMRGAADEPVGVGRLLDLVERSEDDFLVASATRALGEAGDPRALEVLRRLVRDGKAVVAVSAVDALARLDHPDRVDAMLEGVWHPDAEVVKAALQRLADQQVSVRSHLATCLDHEAWDVRRLAADLLGRHGGEGAMSRLRQRLERESEPLVREAIQRALVDLESAMAGIRRTTAPPLRGSSVD